MAQWVDALGYQHVNLRCGQEPAIVALMQGVRRHRAEGTDTQLEHPPIAESKDNGVVEEAVDHMAGMRRTLKDVSERRIQAPIDAAGRVL